MYSIKYTLGEFRDRILKLLRRYSSNGVILPSGEKEDIENRLVTSLNVHLARLWHEFPAGTKRCGLSFFAPSVIADIGSMAVSAGDTVVKTFCGKNIGFFMTVCGKGNVSLTTSGGTSVYNADTTKGERIVIRGGAMNDGTAECVLSFTADTGMEIRDLVVYEGVEASRGDIQLLYGKGVYASYLPADCADVVAVYDDSVYPTRKTDYDVLEDERIILIPSGRGSEYTVEYVTYPPTFDEALGDDSEILLSPLMADALGYMCAADLCPVNDPELYSRLTYKYREILENLYTRRRKNSIVNKFYGLVRKRGVSSAMNGGGN